MELVKIIGIFRLLRHLLSCRAINIDDGGDYDGVSHSGLRIDMLAILLLPSTLERRNYKSISAAFAS